MIDINEKFTVDAPPAEVYAVLSDPHAVVECVQGGALGETHEDGTIDGTITVKFSAMRVVFKGRVKLDLEPEIQRGTVHATGRDGQGGTKFSADASFDIAPLDGGTASEVTATGVVNLSGKMASVIEGAANAVVRRMTAEFVEALSLRCGSGSTRLGPAAAAASVAGGAAGGTLSGSEPAAVPAALLLHGFGGSPSTLRAWGEALSSAGLAVSIPRLPGHGTRWKDLNRTTFDDWYDEADRALSALRAEHSQVFVMGLSLGALLAMALAERRGRDVAGIVLVNPLVTAIAGTPRWIGLARLVRRSIRVSAPNDVHKAGEREAGYDRIPLRSAAALRAAGAQIMAGLGSISTPVLLVTSTNDHVVPVTDGETVAAGIGPAGVAKHVSYDSSYHLVPIDDDAPGLFAASIEFVQQHYPMSARHAG